MKNELLQSFFMWSTFINSALLFCASLAVLLFPDLIYRTQKRFVPFSKERFLQIYYLFLGIFKILIIVFNLVPFLVMLIIS